MNGIWKDMKITYQKMGLSDEKIAKHIICKITKTLNREGQLGSCDKKGDKKNEPK